MYSVYTRINSIVALGSVVLCALTVLNACSVLWLPNVEPSVEIVVDSAKVLAYRNNQEVFVNFNLSYDLVSMWNWNVKQLFVSVRLDYSRPGAGSRAQTVLWDRVIRRKRDCVVPLVRNYAKQGKRYGVIEEGVLTGQEAVLTFTAHVVPISGLLRRRTWVTNGFILGRVN